MAAGITINGSGIGGAFVGSSEVGKIYLGNVEVYSKPSAAGITLEVQAASGMEGEGSLSINYNSQNVSYWDGTELDPPEKTLGLPFVEGAQMSVQYNCRYGYCRAIQNGTTIHTNSASASTFTFTPNVGDAIRVEFYWED